MTYTWKPHRTGKTPTGAKTKFTPVKALPALCLERFASPCCRPRAVKPLGPRFSASNGLTRLSLGRPNCKSFPTLSDNLDGRENRPARNPPARIQGTLPRRKELEKGAKKPAICTRSALFHHKKDQSFPVFTPYFSTTPGREKTMPATFQFFPSLSKRSASSSALESVSCPLSPIFTQTPPPMPKNSGL